MKTADAVVIGCGIIGSAAAYYLAKAGVNVVLVDRGGPNTGGTASQACAGGVRQQGRMALEIPLAIYSIDLWANLETELDADLQYRRDGMTVMTDDEKLIPVLQQRVEAERALGLDARLIDAAELHERIPGLSPRMIAGDYCPTDGHADPLRTINAFVTTAERLGAEMKWQCPVKRILIDKNNITGVETSKGNISCRQVVLAAGYWSRSLAATIGLDLPLQPFTLQMMITARRPHTLDQVLGWLGHGISLKQVPAGGYLIGGGWPGYGEPDKYCTHLLPGRQAAVVGLDPLSLTAAHLMSEAGAHVHGIMLPYDNGLQFGDATTKRAIETLARFSDYSPSRILALLGKIGGKMGGIAANLFPMSGIKVNGSRLLLRRAARAVEGRHRAEHIVVAGVTAGGEVLSGRDQRWSVDVVITSAGLSPLAELAQVGGCPLVHMPDLGGWVPIHTPRLETPLEGLFVAGSITGVEASEVAEAQGRLAGMVAAGYLDLISPANVEAGVATHQAALDSARKKAPAFLPDIEKGRSELYHYAQYHYPR